MAKKGAKGARPGATSSAGPGKKAAAKAAAAKKAALAAEPPGSSGSQTDAGTRKAPGPAEPQPDVTPGW